MLPNRRWQYYKTIRNVTDLALQLQIALITWQQAQSLMTVCISDNYLSATVLNANCPWHCTAELVSKRAVSVCRTMRPCQYNTVDVNANRSHLGNTIQIKMLAWTHRPHRPTVEVLVWHTVLATHPLDLCQFPHQCHSPAHITLHQIC